MMQKSWFKMTIWIIATSFFFMAASMVIAALGPGASEQQIMAYMSGMMGAMESLMGLSMSLESDPELKRLIFTASSITLPLILISIVAGLYVRFSKGKRDVR